MEFCFIHQNIVCFHILDSRRHLSTPMFSSLTETVDKSEDAEIIRGDTGSVRGVRNKARSGIATFLDGPIKKVRHRKKYSLCLVVKVQLLKIMRKVGFPSE